MKMTAEQIVRALAAGNPMDENRYACALCNTVSADRPGFDHDEECPFRMAREWVAVNPIPCAAIDVTPKQRHDARVSAVNVFRLQRGARSQVVVYIRPNLIRARIHEPNMPVEVRHVRLSSQRFFCELHGDVYLAMHEDETDCPACPVCLSAGVIEIVPPKD